MDDAFTLVGQDESAIPRAAVLDSPVGWLFSADYASRATCFLVHDWWIATAAHVMASPADAGDFIAVFGFVKGALPGSRDPWATDPQHGGFFTARPHLDVSFVRLRPRGAGGDPPATRHGRVPLGSPTAPGGETQAILVHHPDATRFKAVSTGKVERLGPDGLLVHTAPAGPGSSGAPLFDEKGGWIGVHKGDAGGDGLWEATSARHIVSAMGNAPGLPPELCEAILPGGACGHD